MSFDQRVWSPTGSTLRPIIFVLRFSNSGISPAMYPSSVVQTGVKSLGWENRTAQPLPIQSWKLIVPWVVSVVKLGASSLMRSDIVEPPCAGFARRRIGAAVQKPPASPACFLRVPVLTRNMAQPASRRKPDGPRAPSRSAPQPVGWTDQALQIARAMDNSPHDNAVVLGKRLIENDIGPDDKAAWCPRELRPCAHDFWRVRENLQRSVDA